MRVRGSCHGHCVDSGHEVYVFFSGQLCEVLCVKCWSR